MNFDTKKDKIIYGSIAFIIAGIILFSINLIEYIEVRSIVNSEEAIEVFAEIYDYNESFVGSSGEKTKKCETYYEFFIGGNRYTGENDGCHNSMPLGDNIAIYYNRDNPNENYTMETASVFHLWPILIILAGCGVFVYAKKAIIL